MKPLAERVQTFLALDSQRTPGEWRIGDANGGETCEYLPFWVIGHEQVSLDRKDGEAPEEWFMELHVGNLPDAQFVTAAANDAPSIIREQQAEIARLRAALSSLVGAMDKGMIVRTHRDHACGVCVPDGEIVKPGFLCAEHNAVRALSTTEGGKP